MSFWDDLGDVAADLDPTNPNNWTYDVAPIVFPGVGNVVQSIGAKHAAKNAAERENAKAEDRRSYYDELGQEFQGVPKDPNTQSRADELYDPMAKEIERGAYAAGRGAARSYSQRGIGGSGYAAAAQSGIEQAAGAERERARLAAFNSALAEGRSGLMGQANISHMGDPFLAQMVANANAELARAQAEQARQATQYQEILLKLAGIPMGEGGLPGVGGGLPAGGTIGGVQAPLQIVTGPNGSPYWSDGTPVAAY